MKLEHAVTMKRARVEMIPLIDCMFILLVFFIYSMLSMTLQRGITVELPTARALETNDEASIVVSITSAGSIHVDDTPVTLDELGAAIADARRGLDRPRFVINADTRSQHGRFIRVMDELRVQGVSQVMVLSTDRVKGDAP